MARHECPVTLRYVLLYLFGTVITVQGTSCGQYSGFSFTQKYCSSGYHCCGSRSYRYCCMDDDFFYDGIDVGTIAGIVVGSLVGLGLFISCMVCLCAACNKSGSRGGRVVNPNRTQSSVAIVNTNNMEGYGMSAYPSYPRPAYPQQGPAYPQAAYQQQGPAYPQTGYPSPGQFEPPPAYSD